jgi:hypothetical protein
VFTGHRGRAGVEPFDVNQLDRRATTGVLRALSGVVFGHATLRIGGVTGVQTPVCTGEHVDVVIVAHGRDTATRQ